MANERARALRNNMTDAEKKLWRALRGRRLDGFGFRRLHPMGRTLLTSSALRESSSSNATAASMAMTRRWRTI
ncbi:MAG: DUF559 domain-containing protein [Pseudomonadota bacterium]|nr:DUF559 domain-containing protein [Pseudomonadota bacterium]